MDWMTQQILVAGELENIQYTIPEDMSTFLPTLTETETQGTGTPTPKLQATTSTTESTQPPSTRPNENGVVATEKSQTVSTFTDVGRANQFYQRTLISRRDGCGGVASA